jgi:hypothetical protein
VATHSTIRFLAATLFWATSSQAAGPNEDLREKTGYNLFHPTPDSLLRELTTDRPDKTESPYTVDAGHYQIELDLLKYTQGCTDKAVQTLAIAPSNLKVGLFNNVDLQFIVETYTIQRTSGHDPQAHETVSGFGDVLIRCKTNFWGNDGGTTAGGMMPFLKLPTGATELGNGAVEGGIIFPLAITLPQEWSMGLMTEVDHLRNSDTSNYHQEFINSITFGHEIIGQLAGYLEFFSSISSERDVEWIGTVDFGLTYNLRSNVQLDAGVNIGVTRAADDLDSFVGLSVRF